MPLTFRKRAGCPALGIEFFWRLTLEAAGPDTPTDLLIPELCYDFFYLQRGRVTVVDPARRSVMALPPQSLRGLHTRPVYLRYGGTVTLFGARLALGFAESCCAAPPPNAFTPQAWVRGAPQTLAAFAAQVTRTVQAGGTRQFPSPLLGPDLAESAWLRCYSPRHKRRLYRAVFGLSRQALERVRSLHAFLEHACAFDQEQPPTILGHLNPDLFYDQPHFNRVFKHLTGLAPVEYFNAPARLQENLMAASYNACANDPAML